MSNCLRVPKNIHAGHYKHSTSFFYGGLFAAIHEKKKGNPKHSLKKPPISFRR